LQQFSFAPLGVSFITMRSLKSNAERISASELRQLEARAFAGRSDVYRYLHKNHSRLVDRKVGTNNGPSWDEVAAILSKRGYVSCRGDPLNGHAVRRVFRRVEKDLARGETARRPTHASPPSRQHPDWQPPIAEARQSAPPLSHLGGAEAPTPRSHGTANLPAARTNTPASKEKVELTPHAKAELEKLARMFAQTDRKRFGNL
jgi:hypothetical protein